MSGKMRRAERGVACALVAVVLIGCDLGDRGVMDGFDEQQWATLATLSPPPAVAPCPPGALDPLVGVADLGDDCEALARLGQQIFCDKGFSGPLIATNELGQEGVSGAVACLTCHDPATDFVDARGKPVSVGTGTTKRNTLSLRLVGFYLELGIPLAWTGYYADSFLAVPMARPAMHATPELWAARIGERHAPAYAQLFGPVPDPSQVAASSFTRHVTLALEAYERRLATGLTPFDRYVAGDLAAISPAAKRGLELFIGEALCVECHRGPLLGDGVLRRTRVPPLPTGAADRGAAENAPGAGPSVEDPAFRFRTPSLRQVAGTAPYMHGGQLATLADVLWFYDQGKPAPDADPRLHPLGLGAAGRADLAVFLDTLTAPPALATWGCSP